MLDIVLKPLRGIARVKKERSFLKTFLVLLVSSFLVGGGVYFSSIFMIAGNWQLAAGIGLGSFIMVLLLAFLLKIALHVLAQRGGYYEALTSITYGNFVFAVGIFVYTLLNLIPAPGILRGVLFVVGAFVIMLSSITSVAVTLRMTVELFQLDLFTAVIGFFIVYSAMFMAIYFILLGTMFSSFSALGGSPFSAGLDASSLIK